ncbi:MAG: TonB-dependent receptor [Parasphingorhabdus sp.]|nr:TonB-dependent receptor [Parasphingorhabdus sp.]
MMSMMPSVNSVIPLLEGKPFFENLTVELGGRYSKYSRAGEEFTWKVGGSWEPVVGLKIRGNYQRSSRAPNIGELFTPVTTGLSNLANDPCQGPVAPTGNLLAACLAQVPAGSPGAAAIGAGQVEPPAAGQINITTGGNPNLTTEDATTWTIGALLQPEQIPGFSVSVDYFNIKVTDGISSPTVGDRLNACFGAAICDQPILLAGVYLVVRQPAVLMARRMKYWA